MALTHTPVSKFMAVRICREFTCSISCILTYYEPESDILVKVYAHLNFSRASFVHFRASRYIMDLTHTPEWNVMAVWICWELVCSISSVLIYYAPKSDPRMKSYEHLNFSRAFIVQFRASRYIMRLNRTSEWKVMTIWISRELPLFNFVSLDILRSWIRPPSEKFWPFEILESFHCSISSVSIYYSPESDLRVKS